jgi:hypothetical protein
MTESTRFRIGHKCYVFDPRLLTSRGERNRPQWLRFCRDLVRTRRGHGDL